MKGGGRRKTWMSDGSIVNGKEVRSNSRRAPKYREPTRVFDDPKGCATPQVIKFLRDHRFFKVPIRLADGKASIIQA